MSLDVGKALAGGGALLVTVAFLLGGLAGEQAKPVERVDSLVASSPADKLCPDGWQDTSTSDGHAIVLSCSRDRWLVILKPDRTFDYAWFDGAPDFTYSPEGIPGWTR